MVSEQEYYSRFDVTGCSLLLILAENFSWQKEESRRERKNLLLESTLVGWETLAMAWTISATQIW